MLPPLAQSVAVIDPPVGPQRRYRAFFLFVSPGFLETEHTPLIAGRDFVMGDRKGTQQIAIINETAAHSMFRGMNAVGAIYREADLEGKRQELTVEVVGIVKDVQYQRPGSSPVPRIYRPIAQTLPTGTNFFELQFRGPLSDVIARVRNISTSVDSHIGLEFRLATIFMKCFGGNTLSAS